MNPKLLFLLALLIASSVVLWQISDFPIYFFCDEAVFAQTAYYWIIDAHKDFPKPLPMYHEIAPGRYVPMFSSYLQAIASFAFGLSVPVARSANAIFSLLGVVAVSFAVRSFFAPAVWWLTPLVFSVIPVWFIHSRTVFDNIVAVALLGGLQFFYCQYRLKSPHYLFPLLLCGAAFFYTYASSQIIFPLLVLMLLVSDFRYHWQQRKLILITLLPAILLFLPAIFFILSPANAFNGQMQALGSYLIQSRPFAEKATIFVKNYFSAFDPIFWLSADLDDLKRHRILGQGYFPKMLVPFLIAGFVINLRRLNNPAFRCLLISAIAIPVAGALCEQSINRVLMLIIPFTIWTMVGLEWLLNRRFIYWPATSVVLFLLSISSIMMARDAIVNGKIWYRDYGLYGLQFGTRHLFEQEIPQFLNEYPDYFVRVSPNFANDPSPLVRFFFGRNQKRVELGSINLLHFDHIKENEILVTTPDEYKFIVQSGRFSKVEVLKTVYFPDGTPGFYFLRLKYVENILDVIERERLRRLELVSSTVEINGRPALLKHSMLDMGVAQAMFDGDIRTLARGLEANPFNLQIEFVEPQTISRIRANYGNIRSRSEGSLINDAGEAVKFDFQLDGRTSPEADWVELPNISDVRTIKLQIQNIEGASADHIHIFELAIGKR